MKPFWNPEAPFSRTPGGRRRSSRRSWTHKGSRITLKPGIDYCFRTFYELVRDLIEGAWVRFVQRVNAEKLGSNTDLGSFLFGEDRASLEAYRLDNLAESLDAIGLLHPLVIDSQNRLIAGQRRLEAAKLLKWKTVPVTVVDAAKDAIRELKELGVMRVVMRTATK